MMVRMGRMSPVLFAPDSLQQVFVGQHPPGVGRELGEQPVLDCHQLDRLAGESDPAFGVVDFQVAVLAGLGRLGRGLFAQGCSDSRASSVGENGLTR